MTQEAHTPEPWRVERRQFENVILHSKGDGYNNRVALTTEWSPASPPRTTPVEANANARRIVACVNALAGIPIEAIESGVVAELVEAARGLKNELIDRAVWDGDARVVSAGTGVWARFCNALAKLEASK